MKFAVVSSSALGDRFDAEFHVALDGLRTRVEELRGIVSDDEAVRRLARIPLSDKSALSVLLTGSRTLTTEASNRASRKYPHLALALVEDGAQEAVARIRAEIDRSREALAVLERIGESRVGNVSSIAEPDVDAPKPF